MADSKGSVVWLSATTATFMIAQQIASKAVRDGFFLSQFDVTSLPFATLGAAFVSFAAALFFGKFIASFSPAAAVPVLFAANGLLFLAEASMVDSSPKLVAASLFIHIAAFGAAVVSGFWSVINERFDPYTAKAVIGRVAGGATFGGVLGGALTWMFSDLPLEYLLSGFGASSVVCAIGIGLVARGSTGEKGKRAAAPLLAGVEVIARNAYPRSIAIIVFFVALMQGTIDYVFKAGVTASEPESLVGFFAVFYTLAGVATFLVQAFGSRRLLKRIGVVPTVALLPGTTIVLLVLAFIYPTLWILVILQAGAMVVENSLFRSGYELLYTPVPTEQKRSAKILIDLGSDRLGTAFASGLALLVIAIAVPSIDRALLLAAMVAAITIIGVLFVVQREYVASLADQLRKAFEPAIVVDHTAQLATSFVADVDLWEPVPVSEYGDGETSTIERIGRDELLRMVSDRASEKRDGGVVSNPGESLPLAMPSHRLLDTPLREKLISSDANDAELRQSAPATIGQLGDILLSRRETIDVRLRATELIAGVPSQRSAATLVELLGSPQLRLRRAAALGLLQMCRTAPALRPSKQVLSDFAAKELRKPARPQDPRNEFEMQSPFIIDARGNELSPTLEIVFLLLAINGDAEELRMALTAITSEDSQQRGTGLEYLENLLPGTIRPRLLALVEHPELTQADQRVPQDVISTLANDLRTGEIGVGELRRRYKKARRTRYEQSGQT